MNGPPFLADMVKEKHAIQMIEFVKNDAGQKRSCFDFDGFECCISVTDDDGLRAFHFIAHLRDAEATFLHNPGTR